MINRAQFRWFVGLLVVGLAACGPHVEGHAVATHSAADARHIDASAVRVSALAIPEGAAELGIVQAHVDQGSIEDAMPEFRKQVAQLGGDFGKVTDLETRFELQTRSRTETYNCGSSDKPRNCTRLVTETVEVATTRILGKAYRLGPPTAKAWVSPQPTTSPADEPSPAAPQPDSPLPVPEPERETTPL
jgi:hypothetical protein